MCRGKSGSGWNQRPIGECRDQMDNSEFQCSGTKTNYWRAFERGEVHETFVTDLEATLQARAAEWQLCLNNDTPDGLASFINYVLPECGKKYYEKGAPHADAQLKTDTEERLHLLRLRRGLRLRLADTPEGDQAARIAERLNEVTKRELQGYPTPAIPGSTI